MRAALLFILSLSFSFAAFAQCDDHGKSMNVAFDCYCPLSLSEGRRVPGDCKSSKSFVMDFDTQGRYCFENETQKKKAYERGLQDVLVKAKKEFGTSN